MNFYIARKPRGVVTLPLDRKVIIPGVTDSNELRDLAQAVVEKQGKPYQMADKYLEQMELNHEYEVHLAECWAEIRRRQAGGFRRPINKFIPPKVV